jgi:hypothetical protein
MSVAVPGRRGVAAFASVFYVQERSWAPRRRAGTWVGRTPIVAAPSVHGYGFLLVRRYGSRASIVIAAVTSAAPNRFRALRVPTEEAPTDA